MLVVSLALKLPVGVCSLPGPQACQSWSPDPLLRLSANVVSRVLIWLRARLRLRVRVNTRQDASQHHEW